MGQSPLGPLPGYAYGTLQFMNSCKTLDVPKFSQNTYLDLYILHVTLIICFANFNFSSIVMPQYFTGLLVETGLLLKSTVFRLLK